LKKSEKNNTVFAGKTANSYDAWFQMPSGAYAIELEHQLLLRLHSNWEGKRVLDIGCGTGNQLLLFREQGMSFGVGIDVSGDMLRLAGQKFLETGQKHLFVVKASAEYLPFKAGSFDRVTSITALEFFENPARSVREMKALGAEVYLIAVLNRWSLSSQWRRLKSYFTRNVFRSARFYSPKSLKTLFHKNGFSGADYRMICRTTLHFFPIYFRFLKPVFKGIDTLLTELGSPFGAFLILMITPKCEKKENR